MEAERLMQAVLQSFLDADLRVEVMPRSEDKGQGRTADTGTGPSYDVTTQAHGQGNSYKRPDPVRMTTYAGQQAESSAQAVDGQYASVYRVHHCKMTPTSPPPMPSEFPPQRPEVFYGCDNFQVGGAGSGETSSPPVKTSSYRGAGLNWPNRNEVFSPRMSRCPDRFARSLRKYPATISPERSAEVLERLVTYAMPRAYRSPYRSPPRSPLRSPVRSPHRSPQREPASRKHEDYRPRAPEEYPTRDRRDEFTHFRQTNQQAFAKHEEIRQIREISRKLRKSLKSISSYTHTHTLSTYMDGIEHECDTPILETSETEHEDQPATYSYPVNTTVQAVVPTTSLGVEAKPLPNPSKHTIAVPLSPTASSRLTIQSGAVKSVAPTISLGVEAKLFSTSRRTVAVSITPTSSRLTTRAHDLPSPVVTKSVQTFHFPGRSVETVTSTTVLPKQDPIKNILKKSKSLNDFRLKRDFKSEILEWLDDTNDPKIKEIKDVVLRKLSFRLKGISTTGADKIKVKIGNCLKSCGKRVSKNRLSNEINDNKGSSNSTLSQDLCEFKDSSVVTDLNEFNDIIDERLHNISIKNDDISRPVEKYKVLDTFIERLKYLALEKSKHCSEQTMKEEILRILDEVLIEVNACDKAAFLNKLSDALMCKLDNSLLGGTHTKPNMCYVSTKSNANLHKAQVEATDKVTKKFHVHEMKETTNPDVIKQSIVDLVDYLKDSINHNIGLEEIASTLHKATDKTTKLTKNCENMHLKTYATSFGAQPLTVFMVQHFSRNFVKKTSRTNTSQDSIGSNVDRDVEKSSNRYKKQLAQRIEQWLADFQILRAKDMDFKQAVVLDLASDIVDRQKYLKFNKHKSSDVDELEHLKYLIFKWMKRYLGEENMETVNHAVELMEMIRIIPVPRLCKSQDLLDKSSRRVSCKKDHCEPCTSTHIRKDNVYNSKSDSGIHDGKESQSDTAPSHIVTDNDAINKKRHFKKQTHSNQKSSVNQCNKPNLSSSSVNNNSDSSKCSIDNQMNSNETLNNKPNVKRFTHENLNANNLNKENAVHNDISHFNNINKERHSSEDSFVSSRSRDDLDELYGETRCKPRNDKPGNSIDISKNDIDTLNPSHSPIRNKRKHQNDSILTNYVVHKCIQSNKTNNKSNKREEVTSKRNSSKNKKMFCKTSPNVSTGQSKDASNIDSVRVDDNTAQRENAGGKYINTEPRPSGLVTPVPPHSGKPSSAAQLIAEWRPTPVFTPPPPGRPLIDQVHEEFKDYLKNWCQQIPIPGCSNEDFATAEKSRLGILNGIWKMLTKLKSQPAVFQNKFYYEDVLGKEIDALLDCLPQTQELKEKRLTLKSQLLEKISDMNDLIKEIEMPENYKEIVAQKSEQIKDQKIRKTVRTNVESPGKIMEELLKYCTLDDFLKQIDYKEPNQFLEKAYKNRLLKRIQEYMNELKKTHGKEMEELCDVWEESDIYEELKKVPLPTAEMTKEEADEILLGLEIEQWMTDLPIVKNDDGYEQRHRVRLRDSLARKIHEMEKRANISDCCGNTEVRHEISHFLDMVPLEKDQDLNINEMVGELTDRLKNRHKAGGRRKSISFQDGSQYQDGNQSYRLLNSSDFRLEPPATSSAIYAPDQRRGFQQYDDSQNRDYFQNGPLCSTRIEQPKNWALGEDEDAQFRAFRDDASFGSIIEPRGGYSRDPVMPPDFRCSRDQAPDFDFPPGRINESMRRGSIGYPGSNPEERYQYPNVSGSPKPVAPLSDSQFQSLCEPQSYSPRADHQMASGMGRGGQIPRNEPAFLSMQEAGPPRSPLMLPPAQLFSNGPAYSSHRSQMNPNMSLSQAEMAARQGYSQASCCSPQVPQPSEMPPSFHSPQNAQSYIEPQPYIEPQAFNPNASRFSRGPPRRQDRMEESAGTAYSIGNQEPLEVSVQVHEAPRHRHHGPGFISLVSHQRPREMQNQNQSHQRPHEMPLETSRNQSFRQPIDPSSGQPSIRVIPAPDEIQEAPESAHRSQLQGQVPSRQTTRNQASREPSERPGLLPNAPSSEISNRPVFASTPNRDVNPPPHNIRERRRLEQERGRRFDMDTEEEDDGEERCHCRSRFNQWSARTNCQTCDDCVHGRYYPPYMFPPNMYQPYMYPPFGRPPYPPHCRR